MILTSLLVCNLLCYNVLNAQNSYLALPSGQAMEFIDCSITPYTAQDLPITYPCVGCDPLDEASLEFAFGSDVYLMDQAYKGQYPKFCQQIVHDEHGNLLFFIVDNNIYNNRGLSFNEEGDPGGNPILLHDLGANWDNDINRFQIHFSFAPEISIVPVVPENPEDCDLKYYIFYTLKYYGNSSLWDAPMSRIACFDARHYVRILTYTDELNIELSPPKLILDEIDQGAPLPSWAPSQVCTGITEYNSIDREYLYFIHGLKYLLIYRVGVDIDDIEVENAKIFYNQNSVNSYSGYYPELEICKPIGQSYYLIAYPEGYNEFVTLGVPDNFASIPGLQYGTVQNINQGFTSFPHYDLYTDNAVPLPPPDGNYYDPRFIGFEFSNNCDYLYLTQGCLNGYKVYDIQNDFLYQFETTAYDFSLSTIELGKDGKMYLSNLDVLPPNNGPCNATGEIATISSPNSPAIDPLNPLNPVLTTGNVSLTGYDAIGSMGTVINSGFSHFIFPDQVDDFEFIEFYTAENMIMIQDLFPTSFQPTETWSPGCDNNPFGSVNGHVYLTVDIELPEGIELEIIDMVFHFAESTTFTLKAGNSSINGALLKLDNTIFTSRSACGTDGFWNGILLEGNGSPQGSSISNSQEPALKVSNYSKIENATLAVYASKGGIIDADETLFKNNIRSIKFDEFQNTTLSGTYNIGNFSSFNDCDFTVNYEFLGLLPGANEYFIEHIYFYKVDGVSIRECDFDNQQSDVIFNDTRDFGINAFRAGFDLSCNCDISLQQGEECPEQYRHPSTFQNLNVAVNVLGGNKYLRVNECQFIDNIVGVAVNDLDYAIVIRNDFSVGGTEILNNPNQDKHAIAIITDRSTGYQIEENEIDISTNPNPIYESFGIVIINSLSDNNYVYKNNVSHIMCAVNPLDVNRDDAHAYNGLQIQCNIFTDLTEYDIHVNNPNSQPWDAGISEYQGNMSNNVSAGNCFTYDIPISDGNISNATINHIVYLYSGTVDANNCYHPYKVTQYKVSRHEGNNNSCPSHLEDGYTYPMANAMETTVETSYYTSKTAYYNLLYSYYQQLDGGNTPAILLEIQNTWPQEAWDLRNDLMALAPYVSRDALEEAAMIGVLPDAMLLEICMANPDATKSEEFVTMLENDIPNTLPIYMTDMIRASWGDITSRTLVENGLARYAGERDFYANSLITNARSQDECIIADLIYWHAERASLSDYYAIADLHIEAKDFVEAEYVLDDVEIDFELSENESTGHNNYISYYNFMLDLFNNNKTIHDLNSVDIAILQGIASEPLGFASVKAKNILCFAEGICEPYLGYISETIPKFTSAGSMPLQDLLNSAYYKVSVSPNPATDRAVFIWEMPLLESTALLIITDIKGAVVEEKKITSKVGSWAWELENYKNGVYLYEVSIEQEKVANGKIVITN